jgi:hypothetical protein
MAVLLERVADDFLAPALAVHVRRVEEVDARVDRAVDDGVRFGGLGLAAEHHAAERDRADPDPCSAEAAPPLRG